MSKTFKKVISVTTSLTTILWLSGVAVLAPLAASAAVAGINDRVRIVGTLWYLPKGWNAHMFAADLAGDRDLRDGTTSIVGLSPTDPWVVNLANALAGIK